MAKSKQTAIIISFGLSAAVLVYLLSQLEWRLFVQELGRVNYTLVPVLIGIFVTSSWIRAIRWRYLLPTGMEVSTTKLFSAVCLGTLASCVLPLRAGEFVRPWVLSRGKKVSFPLAFSSVVIERVFDVFVMLSLFAYALNGIENPPVWASVCVKGLAIISAAIVLVMLVAYFRGDAVNSLLNSFVNATLQARFPSLAEKIKAVSVELIRGLKTISSAKELLFTIMWSFVLWLSVSVYYYLGLLCFGLTPDFNVGNVVNVFVALAVAAPSAPGFVGTFQFGCDAALNGIYGYTHELSLAYSVILHSLQLLSTVFLGFFMLRYEGLRFRSLQSSQTQPLEAAPSFNT